MASEVMSVFENVDTAEFALTRLRELDIPLISYRIRPFYDRGEKTVPAISALGAYPAANASSDTAAMSNMYMAIPFFISAGGDNDSPWKEEPNEEVVLHLMVDEYNVKRAKSALISSHGRQVSER